MSCVVLYKLSNVGFKLGLMGTTVLYSSGDEGVAGHGELCIGPNGTEVAETGAFNPTFPGVCPFVTSVGATQVNPGASVSGRAVFQMN